MIEHEHGSDRLGRRAKRLTPLQKYEIWLQLVRGETTISEAAERWAVDRSTIMRLRTVAARLGEAVRELAVKLVLVEVKGRWGRVAGSRPGWTRPPSPVCWTCWSRP